ncbi:MAG: hypothetical protein AABZ19_09725 [Pseudomonadota bacterium]
MPTLHCLSFELSLDTDGVHTFDAQAAAAVGAVGAEGAVGSDATLARIRAEVQQVLAWASVHFPDGPGPLDEGCSWCHDVQDQRDAPKGPDSPRGHWHTVSLSLSGTPAFGEAFARAFAGALAPSVGPID